MQTIVKRVIGNLRAKFNDNFVKIMRGIVVHIEGISWAKKKMAKTKNFLKFEIKVPIHGLR
ncbi:conserved protein of unknown function [Citrobacter freundii]|nr:conserved protein of unknown function [Citrobacter freundii]